MAEIQYRGKTAAYQVKEKTPAFSKAMMHDKKIQLETRNLTKQQLAQAIRTPARPAAGKPSPRAGQGHAAGTARKGIDAAKAAAAAAAKQSANLAGGDDLAESKRDDVTLQAGEHLKKAVVSTKNKAQDVLKTAGNAQKAGMQTARAGKHATQTTAKATAKTARAAQTTAKATARAVKAAKRTVQTTARAVNTAGRTAATAASNPYVWLVVLVVIVVILVIVVVLFFVNSTPKNAMGEKLYGELGAYAMQKDMALLSAFENYENRPEFESIDKENVTKKLNVTPSTSFKHLSAYLVAKLGGELDFETGCAEIDRLHGELYTITATTGTTTATEEQQAVDDDGNPATDDEDNPIMEEVETESQTLTVTLDGMPLHQYLEENIENLLTPQQQAHYNYLLTVSGPGGLTGVAGAPFEDPGFLSRISQEFGVTGPDGLPHRGMDFYYPEGTPLLSVMDGAVVEVTNHWSWGLNVVIESGSYRLRYAHMSAANVTAGDTVAAGEIIGAVGNTGTSYGAHLHLEVEENGRLINPREILAAK